MRRLIVAWILLAMSVGCTATRHAASPLQIRYTTKPFGSFAVIGIESQVTRDQLVSTLREYHQNHPKASYEFVSELKLMPEEVEAIRILFKQGGISVRRFCVPVSFSTSESACGTGFVDLGSGN